VSSRYDSYFLELCSSLLLLPQQLAIYFSEFLLPVTLILINKYAWMFYGWRGTGILGVAMEKASFL
jgi:hypothetical protein